MGKKQQECIALSNSIKVYKKQRESLEKDLKKSKKLTPEMRRIYEMQIDECNIMLIMYYAKSFEMNADTRFKPEENQQGARKYNERLKHYFGEYLRKYFPNASREDSEEIYDSMKKEVEETYSQQMEKIESQQQFDMEP